MDEKALLFYGFSRDDAHTVRDAVESFLDIEVMMISASGREISTVESVLEDMPIETFTDMPVRFMMFLGFEESEISESCRIMPNLAKRPILCTLTENNLTWTISHLLEHLIEEDTRMRNKKPK